MTISSFATKSKALTRYLLVTVDTKNTLRRKKNYLSVYFVRMTY